MIPGLATHAGYGKRRDDDDPHILVAIQDVRDRYAVASLLLDGGLKVTSTPTYGVVDTLLTHADAYDLLVTAQSFSEMGQFGLPQLARSVQPALPILVLEVEAIRGAGVLDAVQDALRRWPLRDRPDTRLH